MIELAILKNFNSGTYKAGVQLAGSLTTYFDDIPVSKDIPESALVIGNRVILATPGDNPKDACVIATWPQGDAGAGMEVHGNEYHDPDFSEATHTHSQLHDRQHALSSGSDHTGQLTPSQLASGSIILLYNDEVDSAETTNTTNETTMKSWSLPANSYSKIIIEAEARDRIEQSANTKCDFTWRIKVGASTSKTYINRIIASSTTGIVSGGREILPLKVIVAGGQGSATTIAITGQMNLANASTGILAHSLRVYGVIA